MLNPCPGIPIPGSSFVPWGHRECHLLCTRESLSSLKKVALCLVLPLGTQPLRPLIGHLLSADLLDRDEPRRPLEPKGAVHLNPSQGTVSLSVGGAGTHASVGLSASHGMGTGIAPAPGMQRA